MEKEKHLEIMRTGIILRAERFDECVDFYQRIFGFPIMFQEQQGDFRLTCFDFQGTYLMIETGGMAKDGEKSMAENPTRLRIHVPDIEKAAEHLKKFGIEPVINRYSWGSTINFPDPDGNSVGLRDEKTFIDQIENFRRV
ncbi:VOC family protein [Hahella ganghwensis]|uniref:VOC family protein n=1 Tax=Hahella ganghwensis TaxID=286420 RepID=UPI000378E2FE|nr:VOC family protein [Hahella ganghwensis]